MIRARVPGRVFRYQTAQPAAKPKRPGLGYSHKEECNPDGPSDIERGAIAAMGERQAIAIWAAIDDALHAIAGRFGVTYQVLRGQADGTGCDYSIRLAVKPRPRALAR